MSDRRRDHMRYRWDRRRVAYRGHTRNRWHLFAPPGHFCLWDVSAGSSSRWLWIQNGCGGQLRLNWERQILLRTPTAETKLRERNILMRGWWTSFIADVHLLHCISSLMLLHIYIAYWAVAYVNISATSVIHFGFYYWFIYTHDGDSSFKVIGGECIKYLINLIDRKKLY